MQMKTPELTGAIARILVINVARIGDTILAVPVLRALRAAYPQAEIVCLAHPKRVEVLQGLPQIDRCAAISKRSAPFMGWLGKAYDLALVFGHEPALLAYALRTARQVVALPTGDVAVDARLFAAITDKGVQHAVDDRLRWLEPLGIPASSRRLDYHVTDAERQAARRWIAEHCGQRRPRVGFQIASFPTKAYRNWPLENFQSLGERIRSRYPDAEILIFGDKPDSVAGERLEQALGAHCHCLAGKLTLRQTLALMEALDLYVGVDTGPTHLAGALGVPMVAMYHCLHPGRYLAPQEHPSYLGVIDHPVDLAHASTMSTMDAITVAAVWAHVERALAKGET
jgi:heptosyltransferase III